MISSHDPDTWPTNFILTSNHHWYQHPRHHSYIMTTSGSLISSYNYYIFSSSRHASFIVQGPSVGLEQGVLEAYKEDYFKINASPGIRWWWLDQGEVPSIATTGAWSRGSTLDRFDKKTTRGATSEVVRKDG